MKNVQSSFLQVRLQGIPTHWKNENKFAATGALIGSSNNKFTFRILYIEPVCWQH
jgi:hypothetical protein